MSLQDDHDRAALLRETGDPAHAWALAMSVDSLIDHFARRYPGLDGDEWYQDALVELYEIAPRYDPTRFPTASFRQFAYGRLRALSKTILERTYRPSASRYSQDRTAAIENAQAYLAQRGRPSSFSDAVRWLEMSPDSAAQLRGQSRVVWTNLDTSDVSAGQPEDHVEVRQLTRRVRSALGGLQDSERALIEGHYGLGGEEPQSLAALSRSMGKQRMWGCRQHRSALDHLRKSVT